MLIIPPKIYITGRVNTTDMMIIITPILSIGITNEIINKMNVNPAKIARNIKKYLLKVIFGNKSITNANKNQQTINRITITNKILFFERFFKPEINLI